MDEDRTGAPREDLFRIEHHEAVRPDDLSPAVHHAEPVAVPVEREAEIGALLDDGRREIRVARGDARVGGWFGKRPSTSQWSSMTSWPRERRRRGAIGPVMPLPASTATRRRRPREIRR